MIAFANKTMLSNGSYCPSADNDCGCVVCPICGDSMPEFVTITISSEPEPSQRPKKTRKEGD